MERLTKRRQDGRVGFAVSGTPSENMYKFPIVLDKLCEYEDLEEGGRLIRLPCKIGDKIWVPFIDGDIAVLRVQGIAIRPTGKVVLNLNDYSLNVYGDEIGNTIYLSKEEAEKHLTDKSKKYII